MYDPSQSERGQLAHGLRYFLENRRTRDTMNAAFVTALVPLAQIAEVSDVLDGQSMERSRWVVLDADLHPLEQQVIHANGEGGESSMLALADRYPPEPAASPGGRPAGRRGCARRQRGSLFASASRSKNAPSA